MNITGIELKKKITDLQNLLASAGMLALVDDFGRIKSMIVDDLHYPMRVVSPLGDAENVLGAKLDARDKWNAVRSCLYGFLAELQSCE